MVELFVTGTLDCAAVLAKIKEKRGKRRQLLLVPDRFMLYYEKAVMEYLGEEACFDVEVVSFARLAGKMLGMTGEKFLSPQGAVMLLRKVIEEKRDEMVCFRSSYGNADFASEIYAVISQIRNSGVSTDMIAEAVERLPRKVVNKTKDILLLYRGYIEALRDGFVDGTSKLDALTSVIERDGLEDADVYISDYLWFTGTERNVCEAIFKRAHSASVFFVGSRGRDNSRIYPTACLNALIERARMAGCAVKIYETEPETVGDRRMIAEQLFSYNGYVCESDGFTGLYSAPSAEEEIMRVAREIKSKVLAGARFRDFAVVCCDAETYLPLVARVFDRCGISYFADRKRSLSSQAAVRLLFSAMRASAKGMKLRDVIEFCKNGILGFDPKEVWAFENRCIKYGIDGYALTSPFSVGTDDPDFAAAEKVRSEICALLAPLSPKNADVKTFASRIDAFMRGCDFDDRLAAYADRLASLDSPEELSCLKQSVDKLKDLVDQSVRLMGNCRMSMSEYCNVLAGAAAGESISMVPLSADSVFVGESRESRYDNISYMYVVGATAGKLPPEHGEGGIFATKESREWREAGLDVEPDCAAQNNAERLNTLMFLLKPTVRLEISYPEFSSGGEALSPSAVIGQLSEMFGIGVERSRGPEKAGSVSEYAYMFADARNAVRELLLYKSRVEAGAAEDETGAYDALYRIACKEAGKERVDELLAGYGPPSSIDVSHVDLWRGGFTSASRFETYFKCPFAHYMDHIVGAEPREEAKIEVTETGTMIHDVLQKYFSRKDYDPGDRAKIKADVERFLDEELRDARFARLASIPRLRGELEELRGRCVFLVTTLVERMRSSDFVPYATEQSFGFGGAYPAIGLDVNGRKLFLRGRIDRIDRCKNDVVILDYKSSSSVTFGVPEVFFGERIQLFVYLAAVTEKDGVRPAGAFYLPMTNRYVKADKENSRFRYVGFINTDGDIPTECDRGFFADDHVGELYPIAKETRKGTALIKGISRQGTAADTLTMSKLSRYVCDLAAKAAAEIDDGYIRPLPRANACNYCRYGGICGYNGVGGERTAFRSADLSKYPYFAGGAQNE